MLIRIAIIILVCDIETVLDCIDTTDESVIPVDNVNKNSYNYTCL